MSRNSFRIAAPSCFRAAAGSASFANDCVSVLFPSRLIAYRAGYALSHSSIFALASSYFALTESYGVTVGADCPKRLACGSRSSGGLRNGSKYTGLNIGSCGSCGSVGDSDSGAF